MVLFALSSLIVSASAFSFKEALKDKKVCERADGYVQATSGNESDMKIVVETVNSKRKDVYANIAKNEGTPVEAVAIEHANEQKPENRCS